MQTPSNANQSNASQAERERHAQTANGGHGARSRSGGDQTGKLIFEISDNSNSFFHMSLIKFFITNNLILIFLY